MLEYYVLNYDHNQNKIVNFNIFNNWVLEEEVIKVIKRYLRAPKQYEAYSLKHGKMLYGFEGFVEELRSLIMWQEWGRVEYEIAVGNLNADEDTLEKWDCYMQTLPNIEMLAREVIYQYRQSLKEE